MKSPIIRMTVTRAKRNPVKGTTTFYVDSETTRRKRYFVQRITKDRKTQWFCNCLDFFNRKLPHVHTNTFSHCKHIRRARRAA